MKSSRRSPDSYFETNCWRRPSLVASSVWLRRNSSRLARRKAIAFEYRSSFAARLTTRSRRSRLENTPKEGILEAMDDSSESVERGCLTRSDIAKLLNVSAKQAGRLMSEMPTIRVGRSHRRVLALDFNVWLDAKRTAPSPHRIDRERRRPPRADRRRSMSPLTPVGGSVFRAAEDFQHTNCKRGAAENPPLAPVNPHNDPHSDHT